ncbi:MAG: hypothetical protein KDA22_14305 [Phycisphaerales bacterium]|nr:hypothetical protein [Phycisphaerales bacterium]
MLLVLRATCGGATAQDALPPGVSWLNPPTPAEQAALPKDAFLVFAREFVGPGPWDLVASIWEIRLEGEGSVVPRVRFEPSSWAPNLLCDQSASRHPDLVRLQVNAEGAPRGYRVNLYRIDYRTWMVHTLWRGTHARALCDSDTVVYLDTLEQPSAAEALRVLRLDSNTIEAPPKGFRHIRSLSGATPRHLVQQDGDPPGRYTVFDPATGEFSSPVDLPVAVELPWSEIAFSDDGAFCAAHLSSDVEPFDEGPWPRFQHRTSTIRVVDTRTGAERRVPIGVGAGEGSGVPLLLDGPFLRFVAPGRLRYLDCPRPHDDQIRFPSSVSEVKELDLATGETIVVADVDPGQERDRAWGIPRRPVPESLRALVETDAPDDHELAFAFLRRHGVVFDRPQAWNDAATAFSDDGRRFVLRISTAACGGDIGGRYFVGDLEADTLRTIPVPDALRTGLNELVYVPAR